ncbi:MAG TPA: pitrilysin family protein [Acidobacteriaceae bacterium]|jgi:zinc protease|nr:pitrilysin family protein [Acidobacteriaceae bacterium]
MLHFTRKYATAIAGLAIFLGLSFASSTAQTATASPATTDHSTTQRATEQVQPWKKIPIPPLPAFHPEHPRRIVLDNGMTIFLEEDHELPFIEGFVVIRGGSRDEPASKVGLIDLYGQAWRTSGTAKMTGDQMDDILEAKAAKIETDGDTDSTSLSWSCLKGDFDQVFGMAVDLLKNPQFRAEDLELAQQQEETGIIRRNDDVDQIAEREAVQLAYGKNNPYARIPEFATVQAVTLADLQQWHTRTATPNNMIVGITGDFNSAEMEAKLRAAFASMPRGDAFKSAPIAFSGPTPGVYFVQKSDVNQSNIWLVGLGTERSNPDYYALSVMNEIFSGGFSSRLFQVVRTRLGLAYSVDGAYGASYDHPGVFYVTAGTKSSSTVEATEAMLQQVRDLKIDPPTESELRKAKDQLLNSYIFHYDSKSKILREQANLDFYNYPSDFIEKYRTGIEKVTAADVTRVARKYIDANKLAILVVGNGAQFGTPLSKLGPVKTLDIAIPLPAGMQGH